MNFQELNIKRVNYQNSFFDTFRRLNPNFNNWFRYRQKMDKDCYILSDHNFGGLNSRQIDGDIKAFCYTEKRHDKIMLNTNDEIGGMTWLRVYLFKAVDRKMYDDIYNKYIKRVANITQCTTVYIIFNKDAQPELYDALATDLKWMRMGIDMDGNIVMGIGVDRYK